MIPKRIFFYWENNKMSWMRYMTLYSFRKLNPEWEIDLYFDDNNDFNDHKWKENIQDYSHFDGVDYFDEIKKLNVNIKQIDSDNDWLSQFKNVTPSGKSNIFKWHQLYKHGGFFADMDIIFVKPIDNFYDYLTENNYNTVFSQNRYKDIMNYLSIGFLASNKNNSFYKDIYENCFKFSNQVEYQTYGVNCVYDLYDMTLKNNDVLSASIEKYKDLKIHNVDFELVYPYDSTKIEYCFNNDIDLNELPPNTIGYHWCAGHPTAQKYNSLLTDKNYKDYNNLFCNICKKIL